MELSILLLKKILSMAVMMLMGYSCIKAKIVKEAHTPLLSALLLYVFAPCLLFNAFVAVEYSREKLEALLLSAVICVFAQLFLIICSWAAGRSPLKADGTEQACMAYTNCGNLLVPLISSLLGMEYVFYLSPFVACVPIACWVHMPRLLTGRSEFEVKRILFNPCILAIEAGVVFFAADMRLPEIVGDAITSVSSSIGSVSMLFTGMLLAGIDLKRAFLNARYLIVSLMKLLLFPFMFIIIIRISGITVNYPDTRALFLTAVMGASAPTATMVLMMANQLGSSSESASAISAMTTVLCIITLPAMVFVFQLLC